MTFLSLDRSTSSTTKGDVTFLGDPLHLRFATPHIPNKRRLLSQAGFTVIELVIVILIVGLIFAVGISQSGATQHFRQQASIRKLVETVQFLHHQAVADQAFYQIEINFETNSYQVGILRPESNVESENAGLILDAGTLTLELSAFLNPGVGSTYTIIPPPNYPSLHDATRLEAGIFFKRVRNLSGVSERGTASTTTIKFSPRGFSEFAVINLESERGMTSTILVNPFSGLTTYFPEERDFEWTYGKRVGET